MISDQACFEVLQLQRKRKRQIVLPVTRSFCLTQFITQYYHFFSRTVISNLSHCRLVFVFEFPQAINSDETHDFN